MPQSHLNQKLLNKLAQKTGKSVKYTREQISRRASRQGIAAEAAQILWAKEYGIGTAHFQRSLPSHVQEQVRDNIPRVLPLNTGGNGTRTSSPSKSLPRKKETIPFRAMIDLLLADKELKERCSDLLKANSKFDRVFREATTVLDDRLKKLGNIKVKMNPSDLTGKVLNPNPDKALLVVSDDADQQEGLYSCVKGLFLAFRNPAHHRLSDTVTRHDALRFCGFVDLVLAILQQARSNPTS